MRSAGSYRSFPNGNPGKIGEQWLGNFFQSYIKFDYWLFIAMIVVVLFGIIALFSLVYKNPGNIYTGIVIKQTGAFWVGLLGILFYLQFNYPTLKKYALPFYSFSIILLILVLLIGTKIRGVRSWFMAGSLSFQPSELAKLAFIICMAKYIEGTSSWETWKDLRGPFFFFCLPVLLILFQPDFGSTLVFFPVALVMLYVGRGKAKNILVIASVAAIASIVLLARMYLELKGNPLPDFVRNFFSNPGFIAVFLLSVFLLLFVVYRLLKYLKYPFKIKSLLGMLGIIALGVAGGSLFESFLKEYQKKRLVVFLDPYIDPLGAGYNIIQSKIAVGSGGLFGKGLFSATQSRLGFLPEQHTDFIFSVICEEFGFAGGLLLLIFLGIIVWRGLIIVSQARDEFGALVATGIVTMFAFHIFLNIGMTLGIMPITGVPLPLVSYGGTSLLMNMFAIGILLNIRMKRFYY